MKFTPVIPNKSKIIHLNVGKFLDIKVYLHESFPIQIEIP